MSEEAMIEEERETEIIDAEMTEVILDREVKEVTRVQEMGKETSAVVTVGPVTGNEAKVGAAVRALKVVVAMADEETDVAAVKVAV